MKVAIEWSPIPFLGRFACAFEVIMGGTTTVTVTGLETETIEESLNAQDATGEIEFVDYSLCPE